MAIKKRRLETALVCELCCGWYARFLCTTNQGCGYGDDGEWGMVGVDKKHDSISDGNVIQNSIDEEFPG